MVWEWIPKPRELPGFKIEHLPPPRVEFEDHYCNAKHSNLIDLGSQPHYLSDSLLDSLMNTVIRYQDRIDATLFLPQVQWRNVPESARQPVSAATAASELAY